MRYCVTDESPLYLFDPSAFRSTSGTLGNDFDVPQFLPRDLFELLGVEGNGARPNFRWLIVGAQRSGSFFHQDPNATSAWNAVVVGEKRWVFYPPDGGPPPGVYPSEDGTDVLTPISLLEWYLNFYDEHEERVAYSKRLHRPLECTARAGDLVFVPSGWWHQAMNTANGFTAAVTQNFVSRVNLSRVLQFLKKGGKLLSGLCDDALANLYENFRAALESNEPIALEAADCCIASKRVRTCDARSETPQRRMDPKKAEEEPFKFNFIV